MNRYRIKYTKGNEGVIFVDADRVCGFKPGCDAYKFKREGELVAAVPKANVASIEKVK